MLRTELYPIPTERDPSNLLVHLQTMGAMVDAALGGAPVAVAPLGTRVEELHRLAASLGGHSGSSTFPAIRDIRIDPATDTSSVALSTDPHPGHTDGSFEKSTIPHFALQFVEADQGGGGISTFWSIADLLVALPVERRRQLETCQVRYERSRPDGTTAIRVGPILEDGPLPVLRYRCDHQVRPVPHNDADIQVLEAIRWIKDWLDRTPPVRYRARPGEVILVANTLVLHGRTQLESDSRRHVRRAWFRHTMSD